MIEPFQQSLPGGAGAVDAACAWAGAIVRSISPELVDAAVDAVRQLVTDAVAHTPPGERLHLRITSDAGLRIEVRDPGAPVPAGADEASRWATLSRQVPEFGTKQIEGEGHLAWVQLPGSDSRDHT